MKKYILFFIVLIGALVVLAPYVTGYLFRNNYYQVFAWYQQEIQNKNKEVQVNIDSYDLGWMRSTVSVTIKSKEETTAHGYNMPPMVLRIKSIIHHGPLFYIHEKWQLGSASIETSFYMPDVLKAFIHESEQGFMQVNTHVSLDGDTWNSHYVIPPDLFGPHIWDGLSGDATLQMRNGEPVKMNNLFTFGKISVPAYPPLLPEINVAPMNMAAEMTLQSINNWDGNASLKSAGLTAKWQDGSAFSLTNVANVSSYSASGSNAFNYATQIAIDSMQLPSSFAVSNITKFNFSVSLKNLNLDGMHNFEKSDDLLKTLTPLSSDDMSINMMTELGAASGHLFLSLTALPNTKDDIANSLNVELNARTAQPLVEKSCKLSCASDRCRATARRGSDSIC